MAQNRAPTAQVTLPPDMSQEDFEKAFASFQKQRVTGKSRDKAIRNATKDLIKKYKTEYDALVKKYSPEKA